MIKGSPPPPGPGAFGKVLPTNNAKKWPTSLMLQWNASGVASSYEYCYDTTNNGACDGTWVNVGTTQ